MFARRYPFIVMDGEGGGGGPQPPADPPANPPATDPPAEPPKLDDAAFARMRQAQAEAERRAKAAEDALAAKERAEAEEQGKWKELAEQEKARADHLEQNAKVAEARRLAERKAGDLKFKDPGYAMYLLAEQQVDLSDPAAVGAALDLIATSRTDLIGAAPPPPPSGGPAGGGPQDPPKLTREQIAAMSPQQVAALDAAVLNAALAG